MQENFQPPPPDAIVERKALLQSAISALATVLDPEVGIDIVSAGFIYGIEVSSDWVHLKMTLTTRSCPMGESIVSMAQSALKSAFQDMEVKISLIWDPPWNPKMITMDGRAALGL